MLEGQEDLFWREKRDEEAWVLTAHCLTNKVEITVAPIDLSDASVGQKVKFRRARAARLNAKFVVTLVDDVILDPSWPCHFNL